MAIKEVVYCDICGSTDDVKKDIVVPCLREFNNGIDIDKLSLLKRDICSSCYRKIVLSQKLVWKDRDYEQNIFYWRYKNETHD